MSQFKRKLSAFTAMLAFVSLSSVSAFAALPTDVIGTTGNMNVSGGNSHLDVDLVGGQNGAVGQVDWKDFSVPKDQTVDFGFSGLSQTIINRVLGGQTSEILGKLTSSCTNGACSSYEQTSKVILINPAGVLFGNGSAVDLNSFTVSTFDFNGAKNLQNMTDEQLADYQSGVLNKFSPVSVVNGENRNYGDIKFDSNYTAAFDEAGIDKDSYIGKTFVNMDGANFDVDKSFNVVSDNIAYKDSVIRTGSNYNYITSSSEKSMSNVRLVTADGVTFQYLANGYADNYEIAQDTKDDVVRNIDINNSGLKADQAAITSGDIHIVNDSNAAGSDINITNSVIKGTKLVNKENGDIMIVGSNDINIANSRLETKNTDVTYDGVSKDTITQNGGEVYISAGKNVNVEDSLILTAGADASTVNGDNAGLVRIYANDGTAKIADSKIITQGGAKIASADKVDINNTFISAKNMADTDQKENISISGTNEVKIHNTIADASGDIDIVSKYSDNSLSGNIVVSSDLDSNNQNQTLLVAGDKLSIQGANTKLDNASVVYDEITFYNDGTTGLNNVTVANNSTFSPIISNGKVGGDIVLETNGNFTLDNATLQRAGYSIKYDRVNPDDTTSDLVDDGTADAINFEYKINPANAINVKVTSTEGDVIAQNNTNVEASKDISLISNKGNTIVKQSDLNAGNDANILAEQGSVYITDNSKVIGDNDVNVIAYDTITFGAQGADNINIDNSVNLTSGNNMLIQSKGGDINAEKTTMPTLTYGDRLTFNAANNNNFTSKNSLKAVNVDFIAGNSNNFSTENDIQFVNSSLTSPNNNITTITDGDVIMNNLTINKATTEAKDTKTTINAKGNVTTKDVTKTIQDDTNAKTHTFPQSVEYNEDGTAQNSVLDINQTKLVVNTKVEAKEPKNDSNGSITLDIKNANNKDAGIELTAENYKWDEQIEANEGPEVRVNAVDDELSISKIITDKLFLDKSDKMYAADVQLTADQLEGLPEGTPSKGYIEVRDKGGFNMDTDPTYNTDPDGFDYTGHYQTEITDIEEIPDPDNDKVVTVTTSEDHKHTIEFDNQQQGSDDFILVYDKTKVETTEEGCDPLPDVDPSDDNIDSLINQIKIPKEQVEVSKNSKVSDNTVDQTSNVMAAAAKIDVSQDSNAKDDKKADEAEE